MFTSWKPARTKASSRSFLPKRRNVASTLIITAAGGIATSLVALFLFETDRFDPSGGILEAIRKMGSSGKIAYLAASLVVVAVCVMTMVSFLSRPDRVSADFRNINFDAPHSLIRMQRQIDRLSESLNQPGKSPGSHLPASDDEERLKLIDEICTRVKNELAESAIQHDHLRSVRQLHAISYNRLHKEIRELNQRARLNLAIGSVVTLVAAGMLFFLVTSAPPDTTTALSLSAHYLPRLSIVVFTEVFAFFFLRLYRNALTDIRAYQVDLTAMTNNATAVEMAFSSGRASDQTAISIALIGSCATPLQPTPENSSSKADAKFIGELALLIEKRLRKPTD